ncbi:MAG TPA: sigma-54-dependent Fis family transcriptional regulator, partial [Desulfobacteraceae bacterium]|nr:sigma-54-dependent Fis family transcriptional regulator [Desulfobacteraceae bacterium]
MTIQDVPIDASRQAPPGVGPDDLPRVILIDDDTDMLAMLRVVVGRKCDCEIRTAESGAIAWELFKTWRPDIIVTDIKMPDLSGLDLLNKVKQLDPSISVIMMTGYGTVEMAVDALKQGAYDFIEKPFDNDHLVLTIQRCLERIKLLRENQTLQQKIDSRAASRKFIGQSPKLKQVLELMGKIADTDVTVLIRGESGTGKELAARVLHQMSGRSGRALVAVNCPALPEHILESELFGYAKGAFTGATSKKKGLFLEADGSTILLDEIGDLPIELQTKLLRVLQEKEIMPLGHTRPIKVDVRVLASTNQDLEEKIRQGLFREDLYYRLNVVSVTMPSLNDMTEDIPLLARHFL